MNQELIELISNVLKPLHYDVVNVEVQKKQKKLRVFIDTLNHTQESNKPIAIGIEDCVIVTKALDAPLDESPIVKQIFDGQYELEVSSPGVERPLTRPLDFEKFKGSQVRIHTFRPLTEAEINNSIYLAKNPKQKNFVGTLKGFEKSGPNEWIALEIQPQTLINIPFTLISKANIEPDWDHLNSKSAKQSNERKTQDSRKGHSA